MKKLLLLATIVVMIASCTGNKSETTTTNTDTLIDVDKMEQKADSTEMQIDKLGDSAKKMMDKAAEKKN